MSPGRPIPHAVLVVTHGGAGAELAALAKELLGPTPDLVSISVTSRDSLETLAAKMEKWAGHTHAETRRIVLTDLKNSSATVAALALAKKYPLDCLCGVNLPLLLKAISQSDVALSDILSAGRAGIDIVCKSK